MKTFIFKYLLIIVVTGMATGQPAQAQLLPDVSVPQWAEPYKQQIWTPQGLLTLVALGLGGYWLMSGEGKKMGVASAHWAGATEKKAARSVAIKQINERRRDGLTTWINTPIISTLKNPRIKDSKVIKRFEISPQANTVFIPDGQRGTTVCGAPGSGKTFSVIDPMIRSVIDQGFPICLYDFKFPGGQAEIHAAYARNKGYDVRIFAPGFEGSESCNLLDFLKSADDSETAGQIAKVLNKNFSLNGGKGGEDPSGLFHSSESLIR
jgi:type IV secretory pathway TraG/TraD family ATPase VirD4